MITRKQYLKTRPICKVTLKLNKKDVDVNKTIHLVGEFNSWNTSSIAMKGLKNGSYTATLDLEPDREYQFRYLVDESRWENDKDADKYVYSEYANCNNSVIIL
ncbi:MAG: isoamylase early set domain-containing protein [Deltaproteobacteria bacterium]|nr:isoamylase early set domain-containing protein [Deltaproteobacteria bacterium]